MNNFISQDIIIINRTHKSWIKKKLQIRLLKIQNNKYLTAHFNVSDEEKCITYNNLPGICMDTLKCNETFNMLDVELNMVIHKDENNQSKHLCGFDESMPRVIITYYIPI